MKCDLKFWVFSVVNELRVQVINVKDLQLMKKVKVLSTELTIEKQTCLSIPNEYNWFMLEPGL